MAETQKLLRQDVLALPEGDLIVRYPTPLSAASIADIKDWLELVERKIVRIATSEPEPAEASHV